MNFNHYVSFYSEKNSQSKKFNMVMLALTTLVINYAQFMSLRCKVWLNHVLIDTISGLFYMNCLCFLFLFSSTLFQLLDFFVCFLFQFYELVYCWWEFSWEEVFWDRTHYRVLADLKLSIELKLPSNSWSSCLRCPNAEFATVLFAFTLIVFCFQFLLKSYLC